MRRLAELLPEPPNTEPSVSGKVLYPYQVDGAAWLRERKAALLGDEPGLGKTNQALRAIPRGGSALIVCPAGLRLVWRDACLDWRPDLRPIVSRVGECVVPNPGELAITSYDSLPDPVPGARRWLIPDGRLSLADCIFDEGHMLKNYRAIRTVKARLLAMQCARVRVLTGTPIPNSPKDLWGILSATGLAHLAFTGPGGSWATFCRIFGGKKNRWGATEFAPEPDPEIRDCLARVMLRRLRADVLPDLPKKTYTTLPIEADAALTFVLDEAEAAWQKHGTDKLPPFELFSTVRAKLAEARIPQVLEQVELYEDAKMPLLVWSAHRAPIEAIAGREGWACITGDTGVELRKTLVDAFQGGLLAGLAIMIQAGGTGLTLTHSCRALFVDLAWNPADNEQAEDRIVRIGQTRAVEIIRMIADHPLERRLLEILTAKKRLIAATIG